MTYGAGVGAPERTAEDDEFDARLSKAIARERAVTPRMVAGKRVVWAPQPGSQVAFLNCPLFEVLYHGTRGPGKRIPNDALVLTDRGWVPAGSVTYADRLVGKSGRFVAIEGIYPSAPRPLWRITFHDGYAVEADDEHRWLSLNSKTGYREGWKVRTTQQLRTMATPCSVPYLDGPVECVTPWTGPDPYTIGLLLGDGTMCSRSVTLYSDQTALIDYVVATHGWKRYRYADQVERAVATSAAAGAPWREVLPAVKAPQKRVPAGLLLASPEDRLAVLQGLLDTDGTIEANGKIRFSSTSKGMVEDAAALAFSLGGAAGVPRWKKHVNGISDGGLGGYWIVAIRHNNRFEPFRLSDKRLRVQTQTKCLTRGIKSIEPVDGERRGVCFRVADEDHCFVMEHFVVTHNSDALLMSFAQHVGAGHGAAWRGVLLRRTYPELADIVAKSRKWFALIFPQADFNTSKMQWTWPTGEQLLLRHMAVPADYWHYHGHEYPWIGFEELTTWPTDECYTPMFSCCRTSKPGVPRMIRATTNPYGIGHSWVADRFQLRGQWWKTIVLREPRAHDGSVEPPRVAIHGHLSENRVLLEADPTYAVTIGSAAKNPAMREAWISGSWDVVAGGMFEDVWDVRHNVVDEFQVPRSWRIDRAFDWGSSKPFSVGWYAQSDGTDLRFPNGRRMRTVRGDVFRIAEWYGWSGRANDGLRMLAVDVAKGIVERELTWGLRTLGDRSRVFAGPADSAIFATENGVNIAVDMLRPVRIGGRMHQGIEWTAADKRPGSRKLGWENMRKMMKAAHPSESGVREQPGFFVVGPKNPQFLRTVPTLPRSEKDPDDVDCWIGGTLVDTPEGSRAIETLRDGDLVHTPIGPCAVKRAHVSGWALTVRVDLSNGLSIEGTADHPVFVDGVGLVALGDLWCGATLIPRTNPCLSLLCESKSSAVSRSGSTKGVDIFSADRVVRWPARSSYIVRSGLLGTVRSLKTAASITRTTTAPTTGSRTSSCWTAESTGGCTSNTEEPTSAKRSRSGLAVSPVARHSERTDASCSSGCRSSNSRADIVVALLARSTASLSSVPRRVVRWGAGFSSRARSAESSFCANPIAHEKCRRVATRVVGLSVGGTLKRVFNLTVHDAGLFYVSGVLSSNTDVEDHVGDETRYRLRSAGGEVRVARSVGLT